MCCFSHINRVEGDQRLIPPQLPLLVCFHPLLVRFKFIFHILSLVDIIIPYVGDRYSIGLFSSGFSRLTVIAFIYHFIVLLVHRILIYLC